MRCHGVLLTATLIGLTALIGCGGHLHGSSSRSGGTTGGGPTLTLSPSAGSYSALVDSAARTVTVTATRADGSADDFTVTTNPAGVVQATKGTTAGTTTPVTLAPVAAGSTTITFTSASDPSVTQSLAAAIANPPSLGLSSSSFTATVGDGPTTVVVTAAKADGSADDFTVASNPPGVVEAAKGTPTGTTTPVTLTPLAAGTATLTFTSASDPLVARALAATVLAAPAGSAQVSLSTSTYTAVQGDAASTVTVTATQADGSADGFTVSAQPAGIVLVTKGTPSGTATPVTLAPLAAGSATLTFTSGSDPAVSATLSVQVTAEYTNPTATYGLSSAQVFPAPATTTAYPDDHLTLTFDAAPTLGSHGAIRIFRAADDQLVDSISLSGESTTLGVAGSRQRGVATTPIVIDGATVTITPHSGALAHGTSYYVGIPAISFSGATLNGRTFEGIGKAAGWTFTTRSSVPSGLATTVTVGPAGDTSVDYHTVQAALNHVMANPGVPSPTIAIKNGTYRELLYLYNRAGVTLKGESRAGVILQYDNYDSLNPGVGSGATGAPTSGGGPAVLLAEDCDLLRLQSLTLKNAHIRANLYSNQAPALYFRSRTATLTTGQRLVAYNANFYSEQDTLHLEGYTWFYNAKVCGNVDPVWGNNYVSLFENSTLETLGDSLYPATVAGYAQGTGGSLVQARTYPGGKGFVFLESTLTYADGPAGVHVATGTNAATYLARSVPGTWVDNVAFVQCKMDTHITALGWEAGIQGNPAPNPSLPTAASGWREYQSMDIYGTPLSTASRSTSARVLNSAEVTAAGLADRTSIFSAISWSPSVPTD